DDSHETKDPEGPRGPAFPQPSGTPRFVPVRTGDGRGELSGMWSPGPRSAAGSVVAGPVPMEPWGIVRAEASMGKLIYAANTSLDGYLEDEAGAFDWSVPDDEVHAFWNEHERGIGTSLYGRRMYETMRVWGSDDWLRGEPAVVRA